MNGRGRRPRRSFVGVAGCAALLLVAGCGPEVPTDELGEVIFEVPTVPGGEEPYILPNLSPPKANAGESAVDAKPGPEAGAGPPADAGAKPPGS